MTKYDKIFSSSAFTTESLNSEEAVAAIAIISAAVDCTIEDIDTESLADILLEFQVFDGYSQEEILEMVNRLVIIAQEEGLGSLFNTANTSLKSDIVLDAFAAGVVMLLEEESMTIPKEKQSYIKQLQQALELQDIEAEEVIREVIAVIEDPQELKQPEIIVDELGQEIYQSPSNNFRVVVPVTSEQGGKIVSQQGMVGFSDSGGTFIRIDYYPLTKEHLETMEEQGQETYLHSVLIERYLPQAILKNILGAEIKYTEYLQDSLLQDTLSSYYYVLVDMPKGSSISQRENNGKPTRLDAYRGLLTFTNGNFLYIVSSQRTFFTGDLRGSILDEAEDMKQNILEFIETMDFGDS
ncbi:hypothetical protein [Cylindrospermopsis raciborskii]|uniref:Uncharacterized protein n=2 Tax=Cylindrospermopsis raciborskii TaxID=77022 RepID=A0A853MH24_9CYAN|nr:hypothetical protein [Cylindrospermopsis raciborskii]EFA71330.1 conserved hypothetical protein [Cylindrospermopsis raciborskii CS-505]MBA4445755.1 hypothetical protein [Cylindrospermopsis raciborskii CS-506_C]MBA4449992.1 hypothetical protein [Cylindrospermopsis raciborskii CS-506_D]MBA4456603.1 hypothetical protein [Cylindrospermopsis raciborskii CS-506_B]MBA4465963.1 hypothetical protein [Cylindrospermopsis raciborskii CS-506_A]